MEQCREPPAPSQDLCDAAAKWGCTPTHSLFRAADLWRLPSRLSFARRLAGAAMKDPVAFWTTATAVRRHGALQKPLELFAYLSFLRRRRIVRCMEIGSLWGGTFYAHCAMTQSDGQAIAVDSFPRESTSHMTARFKKLARPHQNVTCIWKDSHSSATAQEVGAALSGSTLDLLFLDGDHSSEGVRADYEMYSPFVRAGGLIAFHDIVPWPEDRHGVPAFWQRLRSRHESVEFVDPVHPPAGLGIGVIFTR